ncbi:carboxypeptidase regulatory-like domain-containing protein [Zeaxanthinibacter enoshimensis]|uniref:carboxypeptidase regulatory-like domain-containing protein n=1 Tax=Zeaxanthinibacter enoshimensis TaxID=392009 RepID=UPI00356724D8
MIRSKDYSIICILLLSFFGYSQGSLQGIITGADGDPVPGAEVYLENTDALAEADQNGNYVFNNLGEGTYNMVVFAFEFKVFESEVIVDGATVRNITLEPLSETLSEVVLIQERQRVFALKSLKKVEGTAIYAGKKSEVVLMDQLVANVAANNPRQVYSQVVGLNIYENGDAGLQLNIGGRGLDPNRTANFNTRQNGYDISADALGYPESYYTPPAEALSEIQVVRGAASLQYGPQFGGLVNFKFKRPVTDKAIEWTSRQTVGSYNLLTSFNSLSGTVDDFSYYTYFNYKEGDGFRPNSEFNSRNYFGSFNLQLSEDTRLTFEATVLDYLAKQAGGLTDAQFEEDPFFSNRERNWFTVDWKLFSLRLDHRLNQRSDISLQLFNLEANRSALGFRTNRVSQPDDPSEPREFLVDDCRNWGEEFR